MSSDSIQWEEFSTSSLERLVVYLVGQRLQEDG